MNSTPQQAVRYRRDTLVPAHFNKQELLHLDRMMPQGREFYRGTRIPNYKKLGQVFDNPETVSALENHVRTEKAKGGGVKSAKGLEKDKKKGRYGDTEVALIPKHVAGHLNRMLGGGSVNPQTGYPEYFLGGLLSGLAGAIPGMLGRALPAIGSAVSSALPSLGRAAMSVGVPLATQFAMNKMSPQPQQAQQAPQAAAEQPQQMPATQAPSAPAPATPMQQPQQQGQQPSWMQSGGNAAMNGLMQMMQARQSGQGWGDAARSGLQSGAMNFAQTNPMTQQIMSRFGGESSGGAPSPWGQLAGDAFSAFNNARQQGGSPQDMLRRTALDTAYNTASRYNNPMGNAVTGAMDAYRGGGGMEGAMMGGMSGGLRGRTDMPSQAMQSMINARQQGGGLEQMGMAGMGRALEGRNDTPSRMMQSMMRARQQGGGMEDMGLAGANTGFGRMNNQIGRMGQNMVQNRMSGQSYGNSAMNAGMNGAMDAMNRYGGQRQPSGHVRGMPAQDVYMDDEGGSQYPQFA